MEWFKPRTVFALMFYGAFLYMVCTGRETPEVLIGMVNILMGYFFGQRTQRKLLDKISPK